MKKKGNGMNTNRMIRIKGIAAAAVLLAVCFAFAACRGAYRVLSEKQIEKIRAQNVYENERQRVVAEAALSLVGRVSYFWGGKYYEQGECAEWGTLKTVTSEGSSTTGSTIPFGLDCSGFVTWCYAQLGNDREWLLETIGDGTWNQWYKSEEIAKEDAGIGDIAFIRAYPTKQGNHVGIVVGFLNGEPVIAHCSPAENGVVVTSCADTFVFFRRCAD